MLHVSVNLMCMQLHRLHKYPTYAHPVFTKAFEMRYPVLKVTYSPYAQLLPWQHCNMYVVYLFLYFVYLVSADPDIGEIDGK